MKRKSERDFLKLRELARKMDIRVRFVSRKWMTRRIARYTLAAYHPPTRRIMIVSSMKRRPRELVYTLAHEMGHAVDFDGMTAREFKQNGKATVLSNMVSSGQIEIPKHQLKHIRDFVLEGERVAFENGEELMEQLDISVTAQHCQLKKDTMKAYRRLFSPSRF